MSRRDRIKSLYASTADTEKLAMANLSVPPERPSERVPAGPVRSMGLALDRMERESRDLEKALVSGSTVVEIAPDLVESSIVRDRLAPSDDVSFETLKQSIAERGQEVPILVRPHPADHGRYQVAYGHRRLRAAIALRRPVRALVN
jgi:ParB family transcriptional regulator, chromosome partitioning protein